jgi:hypothetical protein
MNSTFSTKNTSDNTDKDMEILEKRTEELRITANFGSNISIQGVPPLKRRMYTLPLDAELGEVDSDDEEPLNEPMNELIAGAPINKTPRKPYEIRDDTMMSYVKFLEECGGSEKEAQKIVEKKLAMFMVEAAKEVEHANLLPTGEKMVNVTKKMEDIKTQIEIEPFADITSIENLTTSITEFISLLEDIENTQERVLDCMEQVD